MDFLEHMIYFFDALRGQESRSRGISKDHCADCACAHIRYRDNPGGSHIGGADG